MYDLGPKFRVFGSGFRAEGYVESNVNTSCPEMETGLFMECFLGRASFRNTRILEAQKCWTSLWLHGNYGVPLLRVRMTAIVCDLQFRGV